MSITGGSGALLGDGVEAFFLNGDGVVVAGGVEISAASHWKTCKRRRCHFGRWGK